METHCIIYHHANYTGYPLRTFSYLSYVLTQEIRSLIDEVTGGKFDHGCFLNHPFVGKLINKILAIFNLSQGEFENN